MNDGARHIERRSEPAKKAETPQTQAKGKSKAEDPRSQYRRRNVKSRECYRVTKHGSRPATGLSKKHTPVRPLITRPKRQEDGEGTGRMIKVSACYSRDNLGLEKDPRNPRGPRPRPAVCKISIRRGQGMNILESGRKI